MIYYKADTEFLLDGLIANGAYVNNASVACSLKNLEETELLTFVLDYVSNSNGDYRGLITGQQSATLTPDTEYWVDVLVTSGGRVVDTRREKHTCSYRGYE